MKSLRVLACLLLAGCASTNVPTDVLKEMAPTGKLRVGTNHQNFLLVNPGSVFGSPTGIVPDIAAELGRRLNVPVEFVSYPTAGATADAVTSGAWDVAFIAAEPQRANQIAFSAAYLEIPVTYLVPAGSKFRTLAEVDRPGVRIVVSAKSAYDLYLSRTLKSATLERAPSIPAAAELFRNGKFDAMVGLRTGLLAEAEKMPGSRVLDGQIYGVQQSIGTPKERQKSASYLRLFVEEIKRSGVVSAAIEKNRVRGVSVAPASP
jgi:polar amino acid transport system substrate-binding protein